MATISRYPETDERHCHMCDFFGWQWRPFGPWGFCFWKNSHFPNGLMPGDHVCIEFSFGGRSILKDETKA